MELGRWCMYFVLAFPLVTQHGTEIRGEYHFANYFCSFAESSEQVLLQNVSFEPQQNNQHPAHTHIQIVATVDRRWHTDVDLSKILVGQIKILDGAEKMGRKK